MRLSPSLDLTNAQKAALQALIDADGNPLSSRQLCEAMRSKGGPGVVKVQIHRLRAKGIAIGSRPGGSGCGYWIDHHQQPETRGVR